VTAVAERPDERPVVENHEFAGFVFRILRALSRRAGRDVDALPVLRDVQREVDVLMREAVAVCRADGYSWGEIAKRLGITRQAAQQRYGTAAVVRPLHRQAPVDAAPSAAAQSPR
jgi:DNA-directed RNA polymerase specialized sigma24 family protein